MSYIPNVELSFAGLDNTQKKQPLEAVPGLTGAQIVAVVDVVMTALFQGGYPVKSYGTNITFTKVS